MQPIGSGEGLFVVVNPSSGRTRRRPDPVPILAERLPDATVHVLAHGEDLLDVLRTAVAADPPPAAIGVYGGDGSVSAAVVVARDAAVPLMVLPGGTYNHFARLLGLSTVAAALDAAAAGSGGGVDLAEIRTSNGPPVLAVNTINIGLYPEFVRQRIGLEPRIGRPLATIAAALSTAVRAAPLQITIAEHSVRVWTLFVGVGSYTPAEGAPLRRRGFDDGVLDVRLLRAGPIQRAAGALALIRHRSDQLGPRTRRIEVERTASVELRGRVHARSGLAHDGEILAAASSGPVRMTIVSLPRAVQVYFPAGSDQSARTRTPPRPGPAPRAT